MESNTYTYSREDFNLDSIRKVFESLYEEERPIRMFTGEAGINLFKETLMKEYRELPEQKAHLPRRGRRPLL